MIGTDAESHPRLVTRPVHPNTHSHSELDSIESQAKLSSLFHHLYLRTPAIQAGPPSAKSSTIPKPHRTAPHPQRITSR
ncbi:hypothetical protein Cob_v002369 [Colletotrichum orbiculare MAFF 240422]|uniref:Uncharacterized protein n=1 Tax=Colletotrichum orbiculare (strain 104-T / ATCC 96160 / CBS 514.97 / LARS 414 / MAFF 240422) TaxID=1213857 RepID=A0A484G4T3_COLOR|nr:hypothetical protein Cob_v002369 [Colletotrichum orbiculare MAFF 240422]